MKISQILNESNLNSIIDDFIKYGETNEASKEWGAKLSVLAREEGNCAMVSDTFLDFLEDRGIKGKTITGKICIEKSFKKYQDDSHTCVFVQNKVIDFTAKQFKQSLPFPRIISLSEFKSEWKNVEIY